MTALLRYSSCLEEMREIRISELDDILDIIEAEQCRVIVGGPKVCMTPDMDGIKRYDLTLEIYDDYRE